MCVRDRLVEITGGDRMTKNILIFADGTGQIGGLRPDQRLSNVYKLYRAMRPGPILADFLLRSGHLL